MYSITPSIVYVTLTFSYQWKLQKYAKLHITEWFACYPSACLTRTRNKSIHMTTTIKCFWRNCMMHEEMINVQKYAARLATNFECILLKTWCILIELLWEPLEMRSLNNPNRQDLPQISTKLSFLILLANLC